MSYTLGLLFEYHQYRFDAIVRVYADDRLVDELCLSSAIESKVVEINKSRFTEYLPESVYNRQVSLPEKLFLFEIDEQHLHDRIRIEVQNDNTNYTNGFMTKFSYLKFRHVFLVPNCLLEHKTWQRLWKRFGAPDPKHHATSRINKQFPNETLPHEIIVRPDIPQVETLSNPTMPNKISFLDHIMGGSFSMEIPLSKKHGLIHLGRLAPGRIIINYWYYNILWVFNQLI